jgi:hypothetical protein
MATAASFDAWDDPGMAFSDVQVKEIDIQEAAEARLMRLIDIYNVIHCIRKLSEAGNIGSSVWAEGALKSLKAQLGYLCVAAQIDHFDAGDIGLEDKEYIAEAQKIEYLEEWVRELRTETDVWLRFHVTLGRRAISTKAWKRADRSRANKVCNAVFNQMVLMDKWLDVLASLNVRRPDTVE